MPLKRREILLGLLGASLPLVVSSCVSEKTGSSSNPSPPTTGTLPEKIRIGYQVIPNPELLAKALGLADKAFPDAKVEYISFDSGRDVNTAIAAKGIDFGALGTVPASVGIASGLPYQVYFILDVIGAAEALIVKKGIKSIADLKGKKVATPFGSTAHFSLESLLALENIPEKDLKILDLQPPDIVAAWQRGDIDASYVWQPNLSKLQKDGGTVLISSADLAKKGIITADLGVVRTEFAGQYPEVVKRYIAVLDEAVKTYRSDPENAIKALAKELNITPEETAAAVKELIWLDSSEQRSPKYLGTTDNPGDFARILKESADFAVNQKKITSAPDLAAFQKSLLTKAL
jgi:taurine transport system substrate-binding protein